MLSKNNRKELARKQVPKRQRFTLKKLTVGVASVLIGFTFMGISAAADSNNAQQTTDQPDVANANNSGSVATTGKTVTLSNNSSASAASESQSNSSAAQTSAVKSNNEESNGNTQTIKVSDLGHGSTAGLTEMKPTTLPSESTVSSTDYNTAASSATIAKPTATSEVSDWSSFVNAVNNSNVGIIVLNGNIQVSPHGMSQPNPVVNPAKLRFTGSGIARKLVIKSADGKNYTIDFNTSNNGYSYYWSFDNKNQQGDKAWDLTFSNVTIKANGELSSTYTGGFAPIYFGDDLNTANATADTITFNNVTANVENGPLIAGSMHSSSSDASDMTVVFTGNNTINNTHVNLDSDALYNYGSTIDAGRVVIANGNTTINTGTAKTNNDLNYGGNAIYTNLGDTTDANGTFQGAVTIAKDATLNINGQSNDVRGIHAVNGTVQVNGNYNADMQAGHSSAIYAANLNIAKGGAVKITTKQDNQADGVEHDWTNALTNYNGTHVAPITLGAGIPAGGAITVTASKTTLTDNGSLTIIRNTGKTNAGLISLGNNGAGAGKTYSMTVGENAILDLQDNSDLAGSGSFGTSGNLSGNYGYYSHTPKVGMITMWGASAHSSLDFNKSRYVNLQRTGDISGTLIRLEGNGTTNIESSDKNGTPVAQWDQANKSEYPSFDWYIKNEMNQNPWGDHAITGFGTFNGTKEGQSFLNAQQADPSSANVSFGSKTGEVSQNAFKNNFNWWKAQRITIGTKGTNDPAYTEADRYEPSYTPVTIKKTDSTGKTSTVSFTNKNGSEVTTNPAATYTVDSTHLPDGMTATVDDNGVVTIKTNNTAEGTYNVPVQITYTGDQSSEKVNVKVTVADDETIPSLPSTKTDADQNDPKGQDVTTTKGTSVPAADGVQWPTGQPIGVNGNPITPTYTWETTPDFTKVGVLPDVVNITYPDGSTDQVAVNVIVNDDTGNVPAITGDASKNSPKGQNINTHIGTVPSAKDGVKWPSGQPVDASGNAINLPDNAYTWSTTPDVYTKGAHPGVIKVTYPDGTTDLVPTIVNVTNAPSGKQTTIKQGDSLPDASSVINWGKKSDGTPITAPNGTNYTWTQSPDTNTPGTKNGVVTITYPNGEKTEVVVPVTVTPTSTTNAYDPYVEPQQYDYSPSGAGVTDDPTSLIKLPTGENAPAGVHYKWGIKPDTTKANTTQQATVIATYPDPNDATKTVTKTIQVIAHIGSMANHYNPAATDLEVPFNADMNHYPASAQISNVPADVVSYDAWAPTPVTSVSGTQPTMIKVTYIDGSWDYVPLNVKVDPADHAQDANKYQPEYGEKTVAQGTTVTDPATWSTADGNQGNPADHSSSATFAPVTGTNGTPAWATVATDGTITLKPGASVPAGNYAIPVQVTYGDNSSETVYAPVTVTGTHHGDDDTIWVYGQNTQMSFRIATFDTHKTNDGSTNAMANVNAPKLDKLVFTNQAYNKNTHQYKDVSSVTYTLNSDGTKYVASSILLNGQTINNPTLAQIQQVNSNAVMEFDVSEVQTSWMPASDPWAQGKDRTPDTDAGNFDTKGDGTTPGSGTKTSKASDQYGDPDGDQRSKSGEELAGNSRARANIKLSGVAANIFGNNIGWINVFGNFYGAEANAPLTFKQHQDISNLTQSQYRDLINVTDLGAGGWNGTNINPNAPQVLAYLPGNNAGNTFWMSWAPNGQPSTATIQNGVSGKVRIHFSDGTWLDIPATINVVADPDSGKTDPDKTEFTQKIVYTYNNHEVATTSIDNIAKGSDVSDTTLRSTIDANVPNNYSIKAGYRYPAGLTNVTATPATIYVPLTLNSGETFSDTGKIVYQTSTGTHIADGSTIKSNDGDILTAALLKDLADQNVPAGYHIIRYPASYTVTGNNFTIPVIIAQDTPSTDTFSQDIQYKTADGTLVKTASGVITGNFTDGSGTATMSNVNSLIDSNMPAGYEYVSGKLTADETVNSTNPAALVVIVKRTGSTPTPEQGQVTITYVEKDNPSNILGTASVTGNNGSSVAVANTINNNVPAHWKIDPSFTVPESETVPGSVTVPLVHATKTVKPGDPGVDPNNPLYQGMFKTVTRTINVNNPDGTVDPTLQQVHFNRSETIDEVTNKVLSYGDWTLADGSARNWGEFDVPQLSGYTSYVDGTAAQSVDAENVTPETADVTVEVTYKTAGDHNNGDHGQQPSNPADNNHNNGGNHGNGNNGNGGNNGGAINNGANGATNLNNGNGNNGNSQAAKKLPQTGNDQSAAAVAGLGLAGLAAMFGLGKRKKED